MRRSPHPSRRCLASALVLLTGCVNPFAPPADDSPLAVTVTEGAPPRIAWTPVGATSVWVTDAVGRSVWGIEAGGRTRADGRYERVLIPSPVAYGAFADDGPSPASPRTTTPAGDLVAGDAYTVHVTHLGGGSGGFTGRRPVVRRGSATFVAR